MLRFKASLGVVLKIINKVLWSYVLFLLTTSAAHAKVLIVSDIDDTIRSLQVHASYFEQLGNATNPNRAFRGLPEIFQFFDQAGAEIHYVSAVVEPFVGFSRKFLDHNSFPQSHHFHNKGWFEDTLEFKVATIRDIIDSGQYTDVVLIGDNGQKDVLAYKEIALDYPQVSVFIHKLYENEESVSVPPSQSLFLTGADFAVQLEEMGFLSDEQSGFVLEQIRKDLMSGDSNILSLILPEWAEVTPADIQRAFASGTKASHQNQEMLEWIRLELFVAVDLQFHPTVFSAAGF